MSSLADLDASALSAAFRAGSLSPVEVTEAVLSRIEAWEPHINAMYLVHAEGARQAARASEARWRAGAPLSAVDGVAVTIKENVYTQGDPAPIGTGAGDLTPKAADAPPSARLREAGCVIVGKTTMPDFGMLSSGLSSIHGITRNPWRLDRNTSGSSSGAGAAGAAGYGPFHVGTDIGGSVRLPATHCGLFTLKPSLGRIPIHPPYMGRVAGPMTRTVTDSAWMLNVLTRPDPRDFMNLPYDGADYVTALEGLDVRGLRIGLIDDMKIGTPVQDNVRATVHAAARALEAAGAVVTPVAPFLTQDMLSGMNTFFEARSFNDLKAMSPEQRARVLPFIVEWCTGKAAGFSGADVMAGYTQVMAMREAAVRTVAAFDFLISPTSPITAYAAELPSPNNDPHNALPHIAFTVAYNMSEQPAASLQWDFSDDGLPIGIQIVGQRFDDLGVMRLSRALEQMRPAQRPWPEAPQKR